LNAPAEVWNLPIDLRYVPIDGVNVGIDVLRVGANVVNLPKQSRLRGCYPDLISSVPLFRDYYGE
jgi:hypothetical protein